MRFSAKAASDASVLTAFSLSLAPAASAGPKEDVDGLADLVVDAQGIYPG
jgi:hypothetical protein